MGSDLDAPVAATADPRAFGGGLLRNIERLDPSAIISGHLPVARGRDRDWSARNLNEALSAGVFDVPDHDTFERLIAVEHGAAA